MRTQKNPNSLKNIKPAYKGRFTSERMRELGSIGGHKSAKVRQERKNLKETLKMILQLPSPKHIQKQLEENFTDFGNIDIQTALALKLVYNAISSNNSNRPGA